ncbi:hypothetical protein BRD19_08695 [Halobacteriales archaeon SW_7_65_23]|nr:MAG: hypothetical protein BRD19_08695 [Halobacteriales archaeon SW_7_65_23]
MCRFMAYHGPPIPLDELLYQPDHSIIQQSIDAQEREEDDRVWRPVPRNHLVTVAPDGTTATEPLALDVPAG